MGIRAAAATVLFGLSLMACSSSDQAAPPATSVTSSPTTTASSTAVSTTTATSVAKSDAGEQFLNLLGPATPPSRSRAVEMGRVMAKDVCPKIRYGDRLITAELLVPLNRAGYSHEDTSWVIKNGQQITLAMSLSFCDPRYS